MSNRNLLLQRTVPRFLRRASLALRAEPNSSGLGSVSLGSIERAPLTRNASPPHVTDEHPGREAEDKNGIDRCV
jgi:hypothetical protein